MIISIDTYISLDKWKDYTQILYYPHVIMVHQVYLGFPFLFSAVVGSG